MTDVFPLLDRGALCRAPLHPAAQGAHRFRPAGCDGRSGARGCAGAIRRAPELDSFSQNNFCV